MIYSGYITIDEFGNLLDEEFEEQLAPIRGDLETLKEDVGALKGDVSRGKGTVRVMRRHFIKKQ